MTQPTATATLTDWPHEFPGAHWLDDEEQQAVLDVLRNGSMFRYYGLGEPRHVDAYEAAARAFYGVEHALGINSGTGALLSAMTAMGVGPGSEVIVPSFFWVACVGAVVQLNAIPVLCEVDDSFNMDPADLEKKITDRTKLIMPIHMAGAPCDMDAIMAVAQKHGVDVLEDCAQCNGGSCRGRSVGTFGRMGIFSLQLNKNMTCGEGGLIVTNDRGLYLKAFSAHDMGLVRVGGRLQEPEASALAWGQGRRMNEMCGAVANVQLAKLPQIVQRMRASKARLREAIGRIGGVQLRRLIDPQGDSGPFVIFMLDSADRAKAAAAHMKNAGLHNVFRIADYGMHVYYNIPSLVKKVPLSPAGNPWSLAENAQSVYSYDRGACPTSDALFERSVLLPIPSKLTTEQEDKAIAIVREAVGG